MTNDLVNPFGQVKAGHIVIKGPTWILKNPFEHQEHDLRGSDGQPFLDASKLFMTGLLELQRHKSHVGQIFLALQLITIPEALPDSKSYYGGYFHGAAFLLLESTGEEERAYRRIGFRLIDSKMKAVEEYWDNIRPKLKATRKIRTVKIV